ncbi:hypothetical protein BGZ94_009195 [Podila epigama]|nr:hypothetical protein BGZ94_009195 [Podila epigama]
MFSALQRSRDSQISILETRDGFDTFMADTPTRPSHSVVPNSMWAENNNRNNDHNKSIHSTRFDSSGPGGRAMDESGFQGASAIMSPNEISNPPMYYFPDEDTESSSGAGVRKIEYNASAVAELAAERQRAETRRQKEANERQMAEAQRQKEAGLQRQREAEVQRQMEAELQRQREAEAQRQKEEELQHLKEENARRKAEIQREVDEQRKARVQRQKEADGQGQAAVNRNRVRKVQQEQVEAHKKGDSAKAIGLSPQHLSSMAPTYIRADEGFSLPPEHLPRSSLIRSRNVQEEHEEDPVLDASVEFLPTVEHAQGPKLEMNSEVDDAFSEEDIDSCDSSEENNKSDQTAARNEMSKSRQKQKAVDIIPVERNVSCTQREGASHGHPEIVKPIASKGNRPSESERKAESRRSNRTRVEPLEYWKNEQLLFEQSKTSPHAGRVIKAVVKAYEVPVENKKKTKLPPKTHGTKKAQRNIEQHTSVRVDNIENEDKRDEKHAIANSGLEEEAVVKGKVKDPSCDGVVERVLAKSKKNMFKFKSCPTGGYEYRVGLSADSLSSGLFKIGPFGVKPKRKANGGTVIFYLVSGKVEATVNECSFVLTCGGRFIVPRGNHYWMKNLGCEECILFYALVKEQGAISQ